MFSLSKSPQEDLNNSNIITNDELLRKILGEISQSLAILNRNILRLNKSIIDFKINLNDFIIPQPPDEESDDSNN